MLIASLILFPIAAAPVLYALGRTKDRMLDSLAAAAAGLEMLLSLLLLIRPAALVVPGILGSGLTFSSGGFRTVYSLVTSGLWLGTTLFGKQYFRHERMGMAGYWAFVFLTLGAAQGVMLSTDIMTTYVFFEILSLSSFPWVLHERTDEAIRAACTYLAVAVIGGLILFMGLLLLFGEAGTLSYDALPAALAGTDRNRVIAAGVCILLGFGAKAGMFPLHVWLPKAHPVAPAPASALLSGLLTKVGVYGILMTVRAVFADSQTFGVILLVPAVITMVLGAVLAVFSTNLKRTLACSSMSQIGFILVGIAAGSLAGAFGTEDGAVLASWGVVLHMVNHSTLKLVLFLCAGAVAMNTHQLSLEKVRGYGRNKPVLHAAFAVGALGISGVPFFNGYLSKTLLHEGLVHAAAHAVWLAPLLRGTEILFLLSGGLTFAYMLRLYLCLFRQKNADSSVQTAYDGDRSCTTPLSSCVLLAGAAVLLALGVPPVSTALAAVMTGTSLEHFAPFAWENLKGAVISLSTGAVVYLVFIRRILCPAGLDRNLWPRRVDLEDTVDRPMLLCILTRILGPVARLFGENLLLRPLCRGLVLAASVIGRAMDRCLDGLVVLLRRTLFREERVRDGSRALRPRRLLTLYHATGEALSRVVDNFSYAMMMTCLGIIMILVMMVILIR